MHWFSIMSEPNTICFACRIKISQRTAAEHGGLLNFWPLPTNAAPISLSRLKAHTATVTEPNNRFVRPKSKMLNACRKS